MTPTRMSAMIAVAAAVACLPQGSSAELFRALEGDVEVDPALPLIAGGALAVESRLHARLPGPPGRPRPAIGEQMLEDTGKVSFARCRPVAARAARAAARTAARRPAHALAVCPDGFAPR